MNDQSEMIGNTDTMQTGNSFWIFGYGSLIWRPEFPYNRRCLGYVKGYKRRFSQLSITHRGTRDRPGRCATLRPSDDDPDTRVWGYAYEISEPESIRIAQEQLLAREVKNGDYLAVIVRFYFYSQSDRNVHSNDDSANSQEMVTYVADSNSHLYSDNVPIAQQAREISNAFGWCGPNTDYLFRLVEFMNTDVPMKFAKQDDPYLFELEHLVKTLMSNKLKMNDDLLTNGS